MDNIKYQISKIKITGIYGTKVPTPITHNPQSATHNPRGVTLIEMAVVLSIVFLLIIMGIVEYFSFGRKAVRNSALVATKAAADALRMYRAGENRYTANINELMPYVNLTALRRQFDQTVPTSPVGGLAILSTTLGVRCIFASPQDLNQPGINYPDSGSYNIMHCVETNETVDYARLTNQPACYSNNSKIGIYNWRACERGL